MQKILIGFQLGVCFHLHPQSLQGSGELLLGSDPVINALGLHGARAGLGNFCQYFFFMTGISFHGLHQLWHQIMSLTQLHIDVGKSILSPVSKTHKTIIKAGDPDGQQHDDSDNDPYHGE